MLRRLAPLLALFACNNPDHGPDSGLASTTSPLLTDPSTPTDGDTGPISGGCGPCGSIASGDLAPAGDARVDGLFLAVDQMRAAVRTTGDEFGADIRALGDVYGVEIGSVDASAVADLASAIKADFAANTEGAAVLVTPASCSSNLTVAAAAMSACEADAGCDVQPPGDELAVRCDGQCTGACEGSCQGELSCAVAAPGVQCEGDCAGACATDSASACPGECFGQCDGSCLAVDTNGDCAGACDGMCVGTCVTPEPRACDGSCNGTCRVEQGSAQCFGDVACRGECNAACTGTCAGQVVPPSSSSDCEATPDCAAQATAQADASLHCTLPLLTLHVALSINVDQGARAGFLARRAALTHHGVRILHGSARLRALLLGDVAGETLWPVSPLTHLNDTLTGVIDLGLGDDLEIPAGRVPCVIPALQDSLGLLAALSVDASATMQAQSAFLALLTDL